jgi:gluconolactonase
MKNLALIVIGLFIYGCGSKSDKTNNDKEENKTVEKTIGLYEAADIDYDLGEVTSGLEGPGVDINGNLYFVNPFKSRSIGKFDATGQFEMFIDQLPEGSTGNGIRFGNKGFMYIADYTGQMYSK